jgi:uncharacterized protein (DUF2164 family)
MKKNIEISKEVKKEIIEEIKEFFLKERDEEIGELAAELVFDFIAEKIGPYFYNQALNDAHYFLSEKLEDLYGLEK